MYTAYSIQLLRHLQLLSDNCCGKNLAGLAASLAEVGTGEPGNLLFIHLLQRGAFHLMIRQTPDRNKLKLKMVTILANLFTRERLPHWFQMDDKNSYPAESKNLIFLTGLPNEMQHLVEEYNEIAVPLYQKFMAAASSDRNLVIVNI
ncbi:unnamed protein product [Strongylus vulgaris]|uniref:Uncharacterized protein n=1 Tax=Strongylus vulgaris TaxID=40348 RepID=A0A3P7IQW9_STRVU|nr:unnamed protein product [Strongylus vulgaris]